MSKKFLDYVKKTCKENGAELRLKKVSFLRVDGFVSNGLFEEVPLRLTVATKQKKSIWLPLLVHEFCHLQQFLEKAPAYTNSFRKSDGACTSVLLDEWISGKRNASKKEVMSWVRKCIDIEIDCEKRVLKMATKWNLPISRERYAQKANAYVLFYHWVRINKIWKSGNESPWKFKEIWSKMPTHFRVNYHNPPDKIIKVFDDFYKGKK